MGRKATMTTTIATTLVTGRWRGPIEFFEHPDRQGLLLPGGEGGDDHFVKAQRKGEHAAREQRRAKIG